MIVKLLLYVTIRAHRCINSRQFCWWSPHRHANIVDSILLLFYKSKRLCTLFYSIMFSILNCYSELWGSIILADIKRIHLQFWKRFLQFKINACNVAINGVLGRYPMYVITYLLKILNTEDIIIQLLFTNML